MTNVEQHLSSVNILSPFHSPWQKDIRSQNDIYQLLGDYYILYHIGLKAVIIGSEMIYLYFSLNKYDIVGTVNILFTDETTDDVIVVFLS